MYNMIQTDLLRFFIIYLIFVIGFSQDMTTFQCVCSNSEEQGCYKLKPDIESDDTFVCNTTSHCVQKKFCTSPRESIVQNSCAAPGKPWCLSQQGMQSIKTACCNTNLCNKDTLVHEELPCDSKSDVHIIIAPIAIVVTIIGIALWIIHSKRKKCSKQRMRSCEEGLNNFGCEMSSMEQTSGSGGLPGLNQRTVGKDITLLQSIGKGGFGEVWKGLYKGEYVAVKIFNTTEEKSWERENEIFNSTMMRHDNILVFIAADIVSNSSVTQMWLVTQYHPLGSLFDYLHQNVLSPLQFLHLVLSVTNGFVHLHQEVFGKFHKPAIAHRDIKSKNILVKDDLTCCVADFGLAVTYQKDINHLDCGTSSKFGTKRYMAPELLDDTINLRDFEAYKRLDVYSFALVLWEVGKRCLIDGTADDYQVPYEGLVPHDPSFDDMKIVSTEMVRPPIPERWHTDQLMKAYGRVVQECWRAKPDSRLTMLRIKKTLSLFATQLEQGLPISPISSVV